jgi:aspartate racemase
MLTLGLLGGMSWESSAHYDRLLNERVRERLVDMGAEGIELGCTEIELLIEQTDSPVPVFPITRLHVEAALDAAFAVPAARP